jgi:hypothetical protein
MTTRHEWQTEDGTFLLERERGDTSLLLPKRGWVRASRLYTLTHFVRASPCDSTRWSALAAGKEVVVVRQADVTDRQEPPSVRTSLSYWFVPGMLVAEPERLRGAGEEDIRRFLLEGIASRVTIAPLGSDVGASIPQVPVSAIEPEIGAELMAAAVRVGKLGGLRVDTEPVAAAREYSESEPVDNLNGTIFCSWRWRLGFAVQAASVTGLLTLEAYASDCDALENEGVENLEHDIGAWIALPMGEASVHHPHPGVRLANLCVECETRKPCEIPF